MLDKYKGLLFFWFVIVLPFKLTNAWSSTDLIIIWIWGSGLILKSMRFWTWTTWLHDPLAVGRWANCLTSPNLSVFHILSGDTISFWLKEIMYQICMAQVLACDIYSIVINSLLASLDWGCFMHWARQCRPLNRNIMKVNIWNSGLANFGGNQWGT